MARGPPEDHDPQRDGSDGQRGHGRRDVLLADAHQAVAGDEQEAPDDGRPRQLPRAGPRGAQPPRGRDGGEDHRACHGEAQPRAGERRQGLHDHPDGEVGRAPHDVDGQQRCPSEQVGLARSGDASAVGDGGSRRGHGPHYATAGGARAARHRALRARLAGPRGSGYDEPPAEVHAWSWPDDASGSRRRPARVGGSMRTRAIGLSGLVSLSLIASACAGASPTPTHGADCHPGARDQRARGVGHRDARWPSPTFAQAPTLKIGVVTDVGTRQRQELQPVLVRRRRRRRHGHRRGQAAVRRAQQLQRLRARHQAASSTQGYNVIVTVGLQPDERHDQGRQGQPQHLVHRRRPGAALHHRHGRSRTPRPRPSAPATRPRCCRSSSPSTTKRTRPATSPGSSRPASPRSARSAPSAASTWCRPSCATSRATSWAPSRSTPTSRSTPATSRRATSRGLQRPGRRQDLRRRSSSSRRATTSCSRSPARPVTASSRPPAPRTSSASASTSTSTSRSAPPTTRPTAAS